MAEQRHALPANMRNGPKYLNDQDRRAFLRKLHRQTGDKRQLAHTRLELIPGVFGARMGFLPRYEPNMEGQTPDWLFLAQESNAYFFADVLNFHMNQSIERKIEEAMQAGQSWGGDLPASEDRLHWPLKEKAAKYRELADRVSLPFVVFIYGWFESFLHPKEVECCLMSSEWGIFKDYPQLSGVYHFDDAVPVGQNPGYHFCFYANPIASRPLNLADGFVPVPIPDP